MVNIIRLSGESKDVDDGETGHFDGQKNGRDSYFDVWVGDFFGRFQNTTAGGGRRGEE
jgi:hypothetical protein